MLQPQAWNLPYLRNKNFTGREDLLADLHKSLFSGENALLTQPLAITGLGGIGKTQIAVEYAYRFTADYPIIWWIRSEKTTTLASDYSRLAIELNLPEKDNIDQNSIVAAVRAYLHNSRYWLLIFDNARQPEDLMDYLPGALNGHVIITSRNPNWGDIARQFKVEVMTRTEAVNFLLKRTGQRDAGTANLLAEQMGDLPLALAQAGAYIEETGKSISGYFQLFREYHSEMLRRGRCSIHYPSTVATTWEISFQEVKKASDRAIDLINLCAFLAPDEIPLDMLTTFMENPLHLDEALISLRRYSLIDAQPESLFVHRLVQAVVRDRLDNEEKEQWAGAAVQLVNLEFPFESDEVQNWSRCASLLPHALYSIDHAEVLQVGAADRGRLLNQIGMYLLGRAQYAEAKSILERALITSQEIYDPTDLSVASCINNLGSALYKLGDMNGAREHFEGALEIYEKVLGHNHPDIADCLSNLGGLLQDLGAIEEARKYYERALKISEDNLSPHHPGVAIRLLNLSMALREMRESHEACSYLERSLKILERALGPNHPTVAINLNNLGLVYFDLKRKEEAREYFERALKISEENLGPNHPDVAIRLSNLSSLLEEAGDLEGARLYTERALKIISNTYGLKHNLVARAHNQLGNILLNLGFIERAREHFEKSLEISELILGPDHPEVALRLISLGGTVLRQLGDLEGARIYLERALIICRDSLGEDHLFTQLAKDNLELIRSS